MKQLLLAGALGVGVTGTAWGQIRVAGSWRLNYIAQGERRWLCYQCPTITFRPGGTGTVVNGRPLVAFTWTQQGNTLKLTVPHGNEIALPSGTYHLALRTSHGERTLTLTGRSDVRHVLTAE